MTKTTMAKESLGNYESLDTIGKGTYGVVFKAKSKDQPIKDCAIKKIDLGKLNDKEKARVTDEIKTLKTCRHDNLVSYYDSFTTDDQKYICIVMELCDKGNLGTYIANTEHGLGEDKCIFFTNQLCKGLKYLHDRNIAHRDVKPRNILITGQNNEEIIKLGDFGLVKQMDFPSQNTAYVGSPNYMSPEMITFEEYNKPTDIWGFGCCFYEMAFKKKAFDSHTNEILRGIILKSEPDFTNFPYCKEMQELCQSMLNKDKTKRPDVDSISALLTNHSHATIFSATWPRTRSFPFNQVAETPKPAPDVQKDEIVQVPVRMTKDERHWLQMAEQIEKIIQERIQAGPELMSKINTAIHETKDREDNSLFKDKMKKILPNDYAAVDCDLDALWSYKRKLFIKKFSLYAVKA